MSDPQYDIHDVTKSATDLMFFGCTSSGTYLPDSVLQIKFSAVIAHYVNAVIRDVSEGVISAWEGVQELRDEYDQLAEKVMFYAKNGIGIAGGLVQIKTGAEITIASRGLGAPYGVYMMGHGYNNIHEGVLNIYNGNNDTVGPVRQLYRDKFQGDYSGDMAYYSVDLIVSGIGLGRQVRKDGAFKLFRTIADDYERAYKQTGKLSLALEALVDSITIQSLYTAMKPDDAAEK